MIDQPKRIPLYKELADQARDNLIIFSEKRRVSKYIQY